VSDVRAQFNQLQWLVMGGIGLAVALALALALGLSTTITRPLHQLSQNAQRIAAGDYRARVALHRQDEVGALAHSFNQMVERLETAEQARGRQLAAIVHELSRPLAGMRAAIETLRDGADTEREVRDTLLGGVEEELGRLVRLVGTLQSLHKRALRPMQLNCTEIALERVIRAGVANFEPVAAELEIELLVDLPPNLPRVYADQDRVIQVLTNLLDNAFKFTPRSGRVTVRAGEDNRGVWVSVADTGVGIAPDELPHVFQQFYRGDESRPLEKRGMGLGLAICREIVMAHQGQIWVESESGQGARFTFTLPKG
jgi:signal transduction histidine kinase